MEIPFPNPKEEKVIEEEKPGLAADKNINNTPHNYHLVETEAEIEAMDERVKDLVEECATFAEESDFPDASQLYDVVYDQKDYPFIPHKL